MIYPLKPYRYPNAQIDFIPWAGFAEYIFPLWLLLRGWRIPESRQRSVPSGVGTPSVAASGARRDAGSNKGRALSEQNLDNNGN